MTHASVEHTGRCPDETAGFLLTETLATFLISAVVLVGLASASSVLVRAVDRSVAQAQDVDDLCRTLDAIARDVSGLTRTRWNGLEPQRFVFEGGSNSLFFAKTQRDGEWPNGTQVIALREIVAEHATRLMRSEAPLSARAKGFDTLDYGQSHELGTGSARLRFSYVPRATGKLEGQRLLAWPLGLVLPAAIVVEAVDRTTGRMITSMRVPIRANADIGCLDKSVERTADASELGTVATRIGFCGYPGNDKTNDQRNQITAAGQASQPVAGPNP